MSEVFSLNRCVFCLWVLELLVVWLGFACLLVCCLHAPAMLHYTVWVGDRETEQLCLLGPDLRSWLGGRGRVDLVLWSVCGVWAVCVVAVSCCTVVVHGGFFFFFNFFYRVIYPLLSYD
jgi:hypothetical protein